MTNNNARIMRHHMVNNSCREDKSSDVSFVQCDICTYDTFWRLDEMMKKCARNQCPLPTMGTSNLHHGY